MCMKTNLSFTLAFVCFSLFFSLSAQNINDGGFESKWETIQGFTGPYEDYSNSDKTDLIKTLNSLIDFEDIIETELTAFKESPGHDSDHAIRVVSKLFSGTLFVPGAFGSLTEGYAEEYLATGGITVQLPFRFKPLKFTGFYKYTPVAGDSAVIELEMYDEDLLLGGGYFREKNTVSDWTSFEIVVDYEIDYADPNEIRLLFVSSAGYDFGDLENCKGQVGSTLYIDDIAFHYELGLVEPLMEKCKVNVYPNPVMETVNFEFEKEIEGRLVIYNLQGMEVASSNFERGKNVNINLSNLATGTYLYRVIDGNLILTSGSLIKN